MKRTLLTTGLVVALLLSMTFPASAVSMETLPDSATETVEGITETPTNEGAESKIKVDVPAKAEFALNPYQISIETPDGPTRDAVISEAQTISSQTPMPLLVMVSATGVAYGEASLAASPEDFAPDAKSAFLWIEFQNVTDGEKPVWSGKYVGRRNQVLLNGEHRPVLELPASENGEPVQAVFRIFGAAGVPSEGMWTVDDGVDVSLSFEFEIIEDEEASLFGVSFAEDAEPSEVAEPVENAQPSDIAEPVENAEVSDIAEPVEDTESSDIAESVEDAEASEDTEPVKDAQPSDIAEPVEDTEPSDIAEPIKDTELSEVAEPVEIAESSDDTEPMEGAEASDVAEPVEDMEASEDNKNSSDEDELVTLTDEITPLADTPFVGGSQSVGQARPVKKTELSDEEPVEGVEASEDKESSEDTEPIKDAQPSDVAEPAEDTEPSDVAEPVEEVETSEDTEPIKDAQPSDVAGPAEDTEPSDIAESVEDAEASEDTEPIKDAQPSDVAGPVKDTETSEDKNFAGGAEFP